MANLKVVQPIIRLGNAPVAVEVRLGDELLLTLHDNLDKPGVLAQSRLVISDDPDNFVKINLMQQPGVKVARMYWLVISRISRG